MGLKILVLSLATALIAAEVNFKSVNNRIVDKVRSKCHETNDHVTSVASSTTLVVYNLQFMDNFLANFAPVLIINE